jgi:hypothetical protein
MASPDRVLRYGTARQFRLASRGEAKYFVSPSAAPKLKNLSGERCGASRRLAVRGKRGIPETAVPDFWPAFDHERIPELEHGILKQVPRNHGRCQRERKTNEK